MSKPFLTAHWRHLLFLNYETDTALVKRYLPRGTELDLLNGRALVSIVAFRFTDTRLLGVAPPFHRHFDEINLRAYVRRRVDGKWRRGVVFVRELVPRPAIAWIARLAYNEPYRAVRMRHTIAIDEQTGGSLSYEWKQAGAWHRVAASVGGSSKPIDPDSDTGFITEHYFGYTKQRDGGTVEYAVSHDRWNVRPAATAEFHCDVARVYGAEWISTLSAPHASAFLCDGAPVSISYPVSF
jgi:uncharacterized protein